MFCRGDFFIMQLMTAPGALVRQGPRGGVNTYTHLCGARGPLHQGPRGASTHIQNYVGPGGPDTRDPGGSFIMQLRRGPGAPVRTGPRGGVKTYTGLGTGLARACQGLAKGLPRAGKGEGGGEGGRAGVSVSKNGVRKLFFAGPYSFPINRTTFREGSHTRCTQNGSLFLTKSECWKHRLFGL